MAGLSLKQRLLRHMLRQHSVWVSSGDLQRLVMRETKYTARTAVRRLEELAEEGKLNVEYRRGHAFYRAKMPPEAPKRPPDARYTLNTINGTLRDKTLFEMA